MKLLYSWLREISGTELSPEDLAEALEVRFLANRDGNLHFGLLTDFRDAAEETLAEDAPLLQLARDHWLIENGQHYRRDRTQDEDRCTVRETNSARVLSLFRSLAIYLYQAQRRRRGGKRSLPDYEKHIHRRPTGLIRRFLDDTD